MRSKHAVTLALLLGAAALLFALSGVMYLQIAEVIEGPHAKRPSSKHTTPPDRALIEGVVPEKFMLFAVPQEHFDGRVLLTSSVSTPTPILKIYPFVLQTLSLEAAVVNADYDAFSLSKNEEEVAVQKGTVLTIFSLLSGQEEQTWTLEDGASWDKADLGSWTSAHCFTRNVWYGEKEAYASPSLTPKSFCTE